MHSSLEKEMLISHLEYNASLYFTDHEYKSWGDMLNRYVNTVHAKNNYQKMQRRYYLTLRKMSNNTNRHNLSKITHSAKKMNY
jgi:hypothetical protein